MPVCGTLATNPGLFSIARFHDTLYYCNSGGGLYKTTIGSNDCSFLGSFSISQNALTVDKDGNVYAMGPNSSQLAIYKPSTGAFSILGSVFGAVPGGDLAFFNGNLYMASSPNTITLIDLTNLSNTKTIMTISNSSVFGLVNVAVDCYTTKIYALGNNRSGGTDIIELDLVNNKEVGVICSLPYVVYDAASVTEDGGYPSVKITSIKKKEICSNVMGDGVLTINATGSSGYTYSLNNTISNSTGAFTGLSAGNYKIHITSQEGCVADSTANLIVVDPPVISSVDALPFCSGNTEKIVINASSISSSVLWYSLNTGAYQTSNTYTNLPVAAYNVSVRDTDYCVSTTPVAKPAFLPQTPYDKIITTANFCNTGNGTINVKLTGALTNPTFSINNGPAIQSSIFPNLTSGNYAISVFSDNVCRFDTTASITDSVTAAPNVVMSTITPTCYNLDNGEMLLNLSGKSQSYAVTFNTNNITLPGLGGNYKFTNLKSGYYPVLIKDSDGCSWDTATTVNTFVLQKPSNITVSGENTTCFRPQIGKINIDVSGSETPYTVSYDQVSFFPVPQTFANLFAGSYMLTVYNNNNCPVDSVKQDLLLIPDATCDTMFVPSAFTPNGDGKNETLRPLGGTGTSNITFAVYNRFGAPVFKNDNLVKGWTGYFNGILQPAGTYVWFLQYTTSTGIVKMQKGTTVLIR
ncbi:gliding motility-associated C-terminal domain-containing protein [Chitinophagaceae bacterium LWZ2-11]